jgi:hypothetical protein
LIQRHEWFGGPSRMPAERHDRREPGRQRHDELRAERRRRRAAEVTDREHQAEQPGREQADAREVEPPGAGLAAVRDDRYGQAEKYDPYRHVDEKNPAPGPVSDEDAAEYRPDNAADRENAGEQPDRAIAVAAELVGDDPGS